jgi:hypothetical protein
MSTAGVVIVSCSIREQSKLTFVAKEINVKSINHRLVECIRTAIGMLVVEFTPLIVR